MDGRALAAFSWFYASRKQFVDLFINHCHLEAGKEDRRPMRRSQGLLLFSDNLAVELVYLVAQDSRA